MPKKVMLYLDDQASEVNHAVDRIRKEFGIEVVLVDSTKRAIAELSQNRYDLLVVDIKMDLDRSVEWSSSGFIVIEKLQSDDFSTFGNGKDIPIVVATAVYDSVVVRRDGSSQLVSEALRQMGIPDERIVRKPWPSRGKDSMIEVVSGTLLGLGWSDA